MNAEELLKIISAMENAISNAGIEPTPDAVLTNAVNYLIHKEQEQSKDKRTEQINNKPSKEEYSDKATPKQLFMIKKLGLEGDFNHLTKKEASKIIQEKIDSKGGAKDESESYY
jgi:hypothetical protein